jgi:RNA polymerase sigma factor (sigma-70 family)
VDVHEFQSVWGEIVPKLVSLAKGRFHLPQAEVDDALQDVALLAWRHFKQGLFREAEHLRAWCLVTMAHRCIDRLRTIRINPASLDIDVASKESSGESATSLEHFAKIVQQQAAKLPPRQRDVMQRFLLGESVGQISKALGITEATVRSLKRFGTMLLRKEITEVDHE